MLSVPPVFGEPVPGFSACTPLWSRLLPPAALFPVLLLLPPLLLLLLLQPAATSASATTPPPTAMVIRPRSLGALRLLCFCGAGPMVAAPSYTGSRQAHPRAGVLRPEKASHRSRC